MHDYIIKGFYWLVPQYGVNNYCVLCTVEAKKANNNLEQRNMSGFITIPLYKLCFNITESRAVAAM